MAVQVVTISIMSDLYPSFVDPMLWAAKVSTVSYPFICISAARKQGSHMW